MLPGGGAPVTRLIMMMRSVPPSQAADILVAMPPERSGAVLAEMRPADLARVVAAVKPGNLPAVLAAMPPERFGAVLAEMRPADLARVVAAGKPDDLRAVLAAVPPDRILAAFRTMQTNRAAELLGALPEEYRSPIIGGFSVEELPPLLEAMNPAQRAALLETMGLHLPQPVPAVRAPEPDAAVAAGSGPRAVPPPAPEPADDEASTRALQYQRSVEQAVGRTAAAVRSSTVGQHGALVVEMFGRVFVVAPRYHERGQLTVDEVNTFEEVAAQLWAHGLLVVTNRQTPREVAAYRAFAHDRGRLIDAVTWVDTRHDGLLQRALVGLVR